eukprot:g3884.t1
MGSFTIKTPVLQFPAVNCRRMQTHGLKLRCNGLHLLFRSKDSPGVVTAHKQTYVQVETNPVLSVSTSARSSGCNTMVISGVIMAAVLGVYFFLKEKLFNSDTNSVEEDDEKIYASALARTRQAIYAHRAVGFMNTNSPARVVVELERALKENSICRSELVHAQHSQDELQGLYRMYLLNADVPPDYGVLLQLRELLGISTKAAAGIEDNIYKMDAFSI